MIDKIRVCRQTTSLGDSHGAGVKCGVADGIQNVPCEPVRVQPQLVVEENAYHQHDTYSRYTEGKRKEETERQEGPAKCSCLTDRDTAGGDRSPWLVQRVLIGG